MSPIHIHKGTKDDLSDVLQLVIELAKFEKAEDQVTASLDDYRRNFDKGVFDFIIAKDEFDNALGICLFYDAFSTWRGKMMYLEDFVVSPAHRSQGIGQLLWDHLIQIAKDTDCIMMKWQVLDWNTEAIKFYKRQQAIIEQEWYNGKLSLRSDVVF